MASMRRANAKVTKWCEAGISNQCATARFGPACVVRTERPSPSSGDSARVVRTGLRRAMSATHADGWRGLARYCESNAPHHRAWSRHDTSGRLLRRLGPADILDAVARAGWSVVPVLLPGEPTMPPAPWRCKHPCGEQDAL